MKNLTFLLIATFLFFASTGLAQNYNVILKTKNTNFNLSQVNKKFQLVPLFPAHYKNAQKGNKSRLANIFSISAASKTEQKNIIKQLNQKPEIIYAVEKPTVYLFDTTNDPSISQQYYLGAINAFAAWDIEQGDSTTVIGIIDTGTDFTHDDLNTKVHRNYADPVNGIDDDLDGFVDNFNGWDLSENNNNPQADINGHGVKVAGIAAAAANNNIGIAGAGRDISYLPIKVMNSNGELNTAWEGIVYAADHGVDVAVCSWGGLVESPFARDIIEYAVYDKDMVIVAAAGNNDNEELFYPAAYKEVISVAATNQNDQKWAGSSYGYYVDLSAPGQDIYSTALGNNYSSGSGTSYAAPSVGAIAALVRHQRPHLNTFQVMQQIINSTYFLDTIPQNVIYSNKLGSGRLDAYKALSDTMISGVDITEMHTHGSTAAGDTIHMRGILTNHLQSAAISIEVESLSDFASLLTTSLNAGILNTGESFSIENNEVPVILHDDIPFDEKITIKFRINDGQKSYNRYFSFYANQSYIDLTRQELNMTVPANGRLGFNRISPLQGNGIWLDNYTNMVWEAGLIYGNSTNEVISTFIGATGLQTLSIADTAYFGTDSLTIHAVMIDTNKTSLMQIKTLQKISIVNYPELTSTIFISYAFINKSENTYNDFHAGLFFDWDLINATTNHMYFDNNNQIAYCENTLEGNMLTGIKIHNQPFHHYAFELKEDTEGIDITDGFTNEERWFALSNERQEAGSSSGDDVAHLVGTEGMTLNPGDTISTTFILTAGFHLSNIITNINEAENYLSGSTSVTAPISKTRLTIYPQPSDSKVIISCDSYLRRIEIYNLNGKPEKQLNLHTKQYLLNTEDLAKGIYVVKAYTAGGAVKNSKLVIQ